MCVAALGSARHSPVRIKRPIASRWPRHLHTPRDWTGRWRLIRLANTATSAQAQRTMHCTSAKQGQPTAAETWCKCQCVMAYAYQCVNIQTATVGWVCVYPQQIENLRFGSLMRLMQFFSPVYVITPVPYDSWRVLNLDWLIVDRLRLTGTWLSWIWFTLSLEIWNSVEF